MRADLVVGADGRNSKVRTLSTITATELGAHLDICWYEVPRRDGDPELSGLELIAEPGATLAVLGQAASWQLGYTIPAGTFPELRAGGIGPVVGALHRRLPWLGDRLDGLTEVNQLSLLPVRITRTDRWSEPGLLLIGDAAHVISPVGGNGVNFAVLDAVEAANRLVGPLLADRVEPAAVDDAAAAVEAARRPQVDRDQERQKQTERDAARRLRSRDPRPPLVLRVFASVPGVARWVARRGVRALTVPPLDDRILHPAASVLAGQHRLDDVAAAGGEVGQQRRALGERDDSVTTCARTASPWARSSVDRLRREPLAVPGVRGAAGHPADLRGAHARARCGGTPRPAAARRRRRCRRRGRSRCPAGAAAAAPEPGRRCGHGTGTRRPRRGRRRRAASAT